MTMAQKELIGMKIDAGEPIAANARQGRKNSLKIAHVLCFINDSVFS